ncbi:MAG: glycoside hydrolase family 95 protein, partial [Planctomycetales bacterium]|nr:glycoside hydrolase family 95 protein [Planctomycetales bacterium]
LLAADTNYLNRRDQGWKKEHPHQLLVSQLAAAAAKPFAVLLEEHVRDYQSLFNRLKLDLGGSGAGIPTDKLLERYQQQADRAVE